METHKKQLRCSRCSLTFTSNPALQKHLRTHGGSSGGSFPCSWCPASFSHVSSRNRHEVIHSELRPFKCTHTDCSMSFKRSQCLQKHLISHTLKLMRRNQTHFKCPYCEKSFTRKLSCQSHMRIHTGEKPFQCSHCLKSFISSSYLDKHLRSHLERLFECPHCKKSFTQDLSLQKHLQTHVGIGQYKCSQCPKIFPSNLHLQRHLHTHSEVLLFKCSHCPRAFSESHHLQTHLRTHTG